MLAFVPGRPDAKLAPAPGEHVQGCDYLGQQARVAIGHARDKQAQAQPLGLTVTSDLTKTQ